MFLAGLPPIFYTHMHGMLHFAQNHYMQAKVKLYL